MRVYNHKLQINFEIHLLFLAYYWASLLNIHDGDIRVVPTHLVFYKIWRLKIKTNNIADPLDPLK
jgi:hypothetical protein